ncbi:MAG: hypothetical protein WA957_04610 [Alteraurantiacibacter sp.]
MTGQPTSDIDEYLAALPIQPLSPPRRNAPTRYQVSRWPLLKAYNGFTGEERRRGGQLAVWLLAACCVALPARCDICDRREPLQQHNETYYHIGRTPAICARCHKSIHLRQWQWDAWRRIVDEATITGREWFVLLPRYGFDMAEHLRSRWGWAVADIEASPMTPLPDFITARLPGNMLPHPELTRDRANDPKFDF